MRHAPDQDCGERFVMQSNFIYAERAMPVAGPHVVIDRTHLGRRASGIERITRELFSDERLAPLPVRGTAGGAGRLTTILRQMVLNPLDAFSRPGNLWVFSGFPPSPAFALAADRSILYVHDLFLVERPGDLNRAARVYMAPNFRLALRRFRFFLANSATTAQRLRPHVQDTAQVLVHRPPSHDLLGLAPLAARPRLAADGPLAIGMIGTIEPRKNYRAAVAVRAGLEARLGRPVELHIVGRTGWGPDADALAGEPRVRLHGFVDDAAMVDLVGRWSLFLSTSHDEGLGLPLMEIQHAGLPVAAPDAPVFREVLGRSGTLIDPADPAGASAALAALLGDPGFAERARDAARANIARWNDLAAADHAAVVAFLSARLAALDRSGTADRQAGAAA
jgi:glycosyltransferase involved in cell wall biosynthesis